MKWNVFKNFKLALITAILTVVISLVLFRLIVSANSFKLIIDDLFSNKGRGLLIILASALIANIMSMTIVDISNIESEKRSKRLEEHKKKKEEQENKLKEKGIEVEKKAPREPVVIDRPKQEYRLEQPSTKNRVDERLEQQFRELYEQRKRERNQ